MQAHGETLSKLDVATRQLTQAIWLFFEQRDPVSVHTLAAAARLVLHDLAGRCGSVITENPALRLERRSQWIRIVNAPQNFFKHANRDPGCVFQFRPEFTRFFLYDASHLYRTITGSLFYEAEVYQVWFCVAYPQFVIEPGLRDVLEAARQQGIDGSDFAFVRFLLRTRGLAT